MFLPYHFTSFRFPKPREGEKRRGKIHRERGEKKGAREREGERMREKKETEREIYKERWRERREAEGERAIKVWKYITN